MAVNTWKTLSKHQALSIMKTYQDSLFGNLAEFILHCC